jgi:hypothetical protein
MCNNGKGMGCCGDVWFEIVETGREMDLSRRVDLAKFPVGVKPRGSLHLLPLLRLYLQILPAQKVLVNFAGCPLEHVYSGLNATLAVLVSRCHQ